MANDKDQAIVQSAVADTGSGLLEFLPSLGQREAIAFGDGMSLPVRIKFDELPKHALPRSSTARFSEKWQKSLGDEGFLEQVVDRWRASGIAGDMNSNLAMMAEAVGLPSGGEAEPEPAHGNPPPAAFPYGDGGQRAQHQAQNGGFGHQTGFNRAAGATMRKDAQPSPVHSPAAANSYGDRRNVQDRRSAPAPQQELPVAAGQGNGTSLRSLRDRLMRNQT
jgi:hypothetical protein